MCGIVGLFAKSTAISDRLGAHLAAMLVELGDRGPDSAGVAIYRDPAAAGWTKLSLYAATEPYDWVDLRSELGAAFGGVAGVEVRASHGVAERPGGGRRRDRLARRAPPRAARDERGNDHRDLQGDGPARAVRRALPARRRAGQPRARTHAHGDREPRHDRALAPVLDRPRPVPRAQRLAVEPQPPAARAAPRGHHVPDRQRLRGRRRVPDVAAARGRDAWTRRSRAASPTWTASTRSSSARSTGSPCCATRSRASPRCSPRTTTGSRWPRSTARSPCSRAPRTRGRGSPRPRTCTAGSAPAYERDEHRERDLRPGREAAARAQPAPARSRRQRRAAPRASSGTRAARTPWRAGSTPTSRSRSRATWATTAPG